MNGRGRIVMLLVVLALCLPSYGEVLVYKYSRRQTHQLLYQGEWTTAKPRTAAYVILDVDYTDYAIGQATIVEYGTYGRDKWYDVEALEGLELVRVAAGTSVTWVVVHKDVDSTEDGLQGEVGMLTGRARARKVGTLQNREVAGRLTGYNLWNFSAPGLRDLGVGTASIRLYPAWTHWANGADGGQSFDRTVDHVTGYLDGKGYSED